MGLTDLNGCGNTEDPPGSAHLCSIPASEGPRGQQAASWASCAAGDGLGFWVPRLGQFSSVQLFSRVRLFVTP